MSKLTEYKRFCLTADSAGYLTHIQRVSSKRFEAVVNGEIKRVYKQRRSCYKFFQRDFAKITPPIQPDLFTN